MPDAPLILLADAPIAAVTVAECGEPLVDLRQTADLRLDPRRRDANGAFAWLRQGVVARLLAAQARLPAGYRLLIVEGYRPPDVQRVEFEAYRAALHAARPEWDPATAHREASAFIAPPEVGPHCTGGAVDLTLCGPDGAELDMGTPVNASPHDSANASYTDAANVSPEATANRRLLAGALAGAGLVNYPTEWWHWSYGERYWAFTTAAPAAIYGPTVTGSPRRTMPPRTTSA